MKPFEEQYTAWVDGTLSPGEAAEFEARLRETGPLSEALADRNEAHQLGLLLRTRLAPAPPLPHADFFTHELLRRIEADRPPAAVDRPEPVAPRWRFARLLLAAALPGAAAALLLFAAISANTPGIDGLPVAYEPNGDYYAEIYNASPGEPTISVYSFTSPGEQIAVLWLDGLDYVPADNQP